MYDFEKVVDAIYSLPRCDKVALWNEYCVDSDCYEDTIRYNDIDELCLDWSPSEVINGIDLDNYNLADVFAVESIYGWRSFDYVDDEMSPFDVDVLAQYIVDNENSFGYLYEDDIINYDIYSDFDVDGLVEALDYEDAKRICLRNDIIIDLDEDATEELREYLTKVVEEHTEVDTSLKEHLMAILGEFVSEDDLNTYAVF